MLTHDELLAELIRQIDAKKFSQREVAARLGIAPARITELKKGTRRLQPSEMPIVADMIGASGGIAARASVIERTALIENLGKVAQGVWLEQSFHDPDDRQFVSYDMRAGDPGPADLFAVTPEGQSMNRRFLPGMQLICRRIPFGDGVFKSGDYVVVERCAHDLRELTCKRVEIDDDGNFWLHSESDQPQFQEPWLLGQPDDGAHIDTEIRVIGKVIRGVVDYA